MFKKLINWLYKKYGSQDIVAMTKQQIFGTTQELQLEELGAADQKQLATEAEMVLRSPAFLMAINNVKRRLMTYIQDEAPDAQAIFLTRFSINGVKLVEEELQNYTDLDVQSYQPFNKHELL